jgi:hypothetical protein
MTVSPWLPYRTLPLGDAPGKMSVYGFCGNDGEVAGAFVYEGFSELRQAANCTE